jgi:hypothetical protein
MRLDHLPSVVQLAAEAEAAPHNHRQCLNQVLLALQYWHPHYRLEHQARHLLKRFPHLKIFRMDAMTML